MLQTKKNPGGCPPGVSIEIAMRSGNDVAVDADADRVVVLILDRVQGSRLSRAGQIGPQHLRPGRCRIKPLILHVEAHIEPRREVVLGAGTDLPPVKVLVAPTLSHLQRRERDRAGGRGGLRVADRQSRGVIVLIPGIRGVDRRSEVWQPEVIVGGVDAPRGRQLDVASGDAEYAVTDEAPAEIVAVELRRADRTALSMVHIAGGAVGVGELPLDVVTLVEIKSGTDACTPAQLVGRMAADL